MIIQTGMRTDIPAFFSDWFTQRLKEGYVYVRNPYNYTNITRYELNPEVVDLIGFCTKNPAPMLPHMDLLKPYHQYWFVTITPYKKNLEPHVPDKNIVMDSFKKLSKIVGLNSIAWRYDPIILDDTWTATNHIKSFEQMASTLSGYTNVCVISFIDLYEKVKKNYPEAKRVSKEDQLTITKAFVQIGGQYGITIKPCGERKALEITGADCSGCMTLATFEKAIGSHLAAPANPQNRPECACYLTGDIGQYNTCGHLCKYCYANIDAEVVTQNMKLHDPLSPLLIGHPTPDDKIIPAKQKSWIDPQMRLEDLFSFF